MLGCIVYQQSTYNALQPARLLYATLMDDITFKDCCAIYPNVAAFGPTTSTGATRRPILLVNGVIHSNLFATNLTSFKGQASASSYGTDWVKTNCVEATTPAVLYTGSHKTDPAHVESLYNTTQGSQIRYRYVNGILTSTALWPWPMNQRIIDATTASGYTVEDVNATIQGFFGTFI
jgi:hypothetical protein